MTTPRRQNPPPGPSEPSEALIDVRGITAGYDGADVLSGVDLRIEPGAFIGIVGPSGSGKTTLLRLLLGQLRPRHGEVQRRPGLRVGYVPQLETVNWDFPATVTECVMMGAESPWPWARRAERTRVAALLARLGIGHLAQRHIRDLSGGQQQRMFLARALHREPHLLVLDEPTSGVDVATRHDMLHLLGELHDAGTAIIVTTHDLNGVAAHVPELVALAGRVIRRGAPREVITPEVLEATFGAPMEVLEHLGMPLVLDRRGHRTHRAHGTHGPHEPHSRTAS